MIDKVLDKNLGVLVTQFKPKPDTGGRFFYPI